MSIERDPQDRRFRINPPEPSKTVLLKATIPWKGKEYDTLIGLLQQILSATLQGPTPSFHSNILVVAITGASTTTRLSASHLYVRTAIIQNIAANAVTMSINSPVTVGTGFILNAASSTGNSGDAMTIGSVDLFDLFFNQTGTGNTLAVYFEA